ncbi:uncharacterized protein BO96DRAFT_6931 [Aspergillus niger CBS 101883]|uniref:uncharacterized protein n=1 Tax=Aspergillus lacticoffeatus (strain CBS 101883) TaxID=1450533 RepID=UPI000D7FB759|nr:uncharacterized protein BO96DRAFT_6931 [Aspergillus niger CBS 101883]PYH61986.1 hypothetical protein BO96DRAFT_6931 [Aspergillus niger CBS 101883]
MLPRNKRACRLLALGPDLTSLAASARWSPNRSYLFVEDWINLPSQHFGLSAILCSVGEKHRPYPIAPPSTDICPTPGYYRLLT